MTEAYGDFSCSDGATGCALSPFSVAIIRSAECLEIQFWITKAVSFGSADVSIGFDPSKCSYRRFVAAEGWAVDGLHIASMYAEAALKFTFDEAAAGYGNARLLCSFFLVATALDIHPNAVRETYLVIE